MADSLHYIERSIATLDKADKLFKDFYSAYSRLHDSWPFSVIFDLDTFEKNKHNLAQIANHIDATQARLLLEKHREGQRASSQSDG